MVLITETQFATVVDEIKQNVLIPGCSVIIFVAPDVDSLCAAKIIEYMLKSECIKYMIVPVAGYDELLVEFDRNVRGTKVADEDDEDEDDDDDDEDTRGTMVNSVFLINCGGMVELVSFFEITEEESYNIYVLDSHRPVDLHNVYGPEMIKILDVGGDIAKVVLPREEALSEEDDDDDDDDGDDDIDDDQDGGDKSGGEEGAPKEPKRKRRKRIFDVEREEQKILRQQKRSQYYQGTSYGSSASIVSYDLVSKGISSANLTELQWLAIVGLTSQYVHEQIDTDKYLEEASEMRSLIIDDTSYDDENIKVTDTRFHIKTEKEYRFMLFRHWSLYDAMYHSQYVATQLGVWTSKGQQSLDRVLACMGIAKSVCNQKYSAMHYTLKNQLHSQLEERAEELQLPEVAFNSFMLKSSCRRPLSASDAVHAIVGLVNQPLAEGKLEWSECCMEAMEALMFKRQSLIDKGLKYAMLQQRAMVRMLSAVLSKRKEIVRPTGKFWVAYLNPSSDEDKEMFTHPTVLTKFLHFLQHALRHEVEKKNQASGSNGQRRKRNIKPVVLLSPNEQAETYLIVGLPKRTRWGEKSKNLLGQAFRMAADTINAAVKHDRFDTSIIEIQKDDLGQFVMGLQAVDISEGG